MAIPPARAKLAFIDISDGTKCGGFKSASGEINKWFSRRALKDHQSGCARVTCVVDPDQPHRPLGFYALATVAEEVNALGGRYQAFRQSDHFSALHLTYLATDRGFIGQGIGTRMVARAIRTFAEVAPLIGLPHMIVLRDPADRERLTAFYARLGFSPYRSGEAMFLPQQTAVAAMLSESTQMAAEAIPQPGEPVGDLSPLESETPAPPAED